MRVTAHLAEGDSAKASKSGSSVMPYIPVDVLEKSNIDRGDKIEAAPTEEGCIVLVCRSQAMKESRKGEL